MKPTTAPDSTEAGRSISRAVLSPDGPWKGNGHTSRTFPAKMLREWGLAQAGRGAEGHGVERGLYRLERRFGGRAAARAGAPGPENALAGRAFPRERSGDFRS
jgi:hypothetical protein